MNTLNATTQFRQVFINSVNILKDIKALINQTKQNLINIVEVKKCEEKSYTSTNKLKTDVSVSITQQ